MLFDCAPQFYNNKIDGIETVGFDILKFSGAINDVLKISHMIAAVFDSIQRHPKIR